MVKGTNPLCIVIYFISFIAFDKWNNEPRAAVLRGDIVSMADKRKRKMRAICARYFQADVGINTFTDNVTSQSHER